MCILLSGLTPLKEKILSKRPASDGSRSLVWCSDLYDLLAEALRPGRTAQTVAAVCIDTLKKKEMEIFSVLHSLDGCPCVGVYQVASPDKKELARQYGASQVLSVTELAGWLGQQMNQPNALKDKGACKSERNFHRLSEQILSEEFCFEVSQETPLPKHAERQVISEIPEKIQAPQPRKSPRQIADRSSPVTLSREEMDALLG